MKGPTIGEPALPPEQGIVDTVPGDASTTVTLAIGAALNGAVGSLGDRDWYVVDLVAGQRYSISLDGAAYGRYGALSDPYLRLWNASGTLVAENDDGGPDNNSLLTFTASATGRCYLDVGAFDDGGSGGYRLAISEVSTPPPPPSTPTYTLDQIADFLITGYWSYNGAHRWSTASDNIITYNLTALTAEGQTLARAAFQTWANVANLVFQEVSLGGDILFDDNESGAFADGNWDWSGRITSMRVNVSTQWLVDSGTTLDSYSFQTYVHEIGHALGLGHGGDYNGWATYGVDNHYQNDNWSYSIMSYFDQSDAGFGSYRFVMGPSLADIVAMHRIYGANTTFNSGNSVYGRNATASSLYDFAAYATTPAFSIYDTGGSDTLDASGFSMNQTINLNAEAFSSIGGLTNNISIARGVIIEGAVGGNGADSVLGNAGNNLLFGNAGADTLDGGAGNDSLDGGAGDDRLIGGSGTDIIDYSRFSGAISFNLASGTATGSGIGTDTLVDIEGAVGGSGADSVLGNAGNNLLSGNAGADTLDGGAGSDNLYGDAGNDMLIADGSGDYLNGGDGDDVILLGSTSLSEILMLFSSTG
ncbi:MAG: M10 family metallopeptidase C-terminal domain-containing protein [Roseomonas sp.]|nr:M10 family metallopeptidase C-terminal domain-containing protein [Roseomonas sp.]MCA3291137.1 M10 family metallopeptidase C-terminal domain-containing protein [Roseomonas sp.]MCA3294449.1 M10 family metallopeptidase C-terminal domain-containing protein [Roseomonas sp.]